MDYVKIAKKNPDTIIWSDESRVQLRRNAETRCIGIRLETFKSHCGVDETYTIVTAVRKECSITSSLVLGVGDRIKLMNNHDITRFEDTMQIKHLMHKLEGGVIEMVVVKPVGRHYPMDCTTKTNQAINFSDSLTLDFSPLSSIATARTSDAVKLTNDCHYSINGKPPSTLCLDSVSGDVTEIIPLKEMHNHVDDSDSKSETSLTTGQQLDNPHEISRCMLELLAVKYPQKIRYEMPFKIVLRKNQDGRLGFSYKIKPNQVKYQGDCNEDRVYDYLVDSITALPAKDHLKVGDCIQSVNGMPLTQRSDKQLKELLKKEGDVVIMFVQRPQALCRSLTHSELTRMLTMITPSRMNNRSMSNGHVETRDVSVKSPSYSGIRHCRRLATMTMTKHVVNSDIHVKPWVKGHRRSQSDSSVMFYQDVLQDGHGLGLTEVQQRPLGDSERRIPMALRPHALPHSLLSVKELQSLISRVFESLGSVTLKRAPLVKLLVLSESGDKTTVQTLLRSPLFSPDCGDITSTVLCVDADGHINDCSTHTIRKFVASGVTVNEIILAKHIACHLCCHQIGLQMVTASLMALSGDVCGVNAYLIGHLLRHPLKKETDIVEVRLECLTPCVHLWPAARFIQHAIYFITFDLDMFLSQSDQLRQVQRQLNVIRSYAGQDASVVLMTDRRNNNIEDVTRVAQQLHETCSFNRQLLCYNAVTMLPLFVREENDWSGRDFVVLEKTLSNLIGHQQPFMTEVYPLAAVAIHKVLLHQQKMAKLKTMSMSQIQWLLYKMFGRSQTLQQDTLMALHHSGTLAYHDGMSEKSSSDPILDMFVLTDLSTIETCVQLLSSPCPHRKNAWHGLLKTGFTDRGYVLSQLRTQYLDTHEILAFLQVYHAIFLSQHHCLLPYHLKWWCSDGLPSWSLHTLYIDFHGFLPVYLGCHVICGLVGLFNTDSDNVEVHSKNSATFSRPLVKFCLELLPHRALCKVLIMFKTTAYRPYTFLSNLEAWLQCVLPPYINWHVGPLCPNQDCPVTTSEVHVLNLSQSEPVYCGEERVCEDDAVQQWVAPPVPESLVSQRGDVSVSRATRLVDLPEDLFMLICDGLRHLDHVSHRDWCGLAGKLGKTHVEVELYKQQFDPSACLLHDWGLTASVQQLIVQLEHLGRSDLVRHIRQYMEGH